MKTDLTRDTFDPAKRLSSVRLKQGAMQMDADWNEQVDILAHREAQTVGDVIGRAGAPQDADGFHLLGAAAGLSAAEAARPGNQPAPALAAGDFLITAGRAYIEGRLCENPAITTYLTQPDLPGLTALADPGVYLAYLDVWERTITSLEDPSIREVALGGPSTATRTRRIWQVRTVRVGDSGTPVTCADSLPAYDAIITPPTGRLAARAEPDASASGPCIIPETAGYRSLENQLYRVECIRAGNRTTARFVWSRENGSVVTDWLGQNGPELTVGSTGPDRAHGFANGDWVELFDAGRELRGEPGTLVRILTVRNDVLVIDPATASGPVAFAQFPAQPRIRRWDGEGAFAADAGNWVALEQGVQVRFEPGQYRTGDFWMIPARTLTGDIEWPRDSLNAPLAQPAKGIVHHHARLAILDFDGATVTATDCRALFPPLTGLVQIDYAGGDGQEAMPDLSNPGAGVDLPEPLRVAVSRGATPVAGARVRFQIASGGGQVNGAGNIIVATGADGIASVSWRLGAVGQPQRVEAQLLNPAGTPRHVPLHFTANFSMASQVAIDPAACPALTNARTVQEAIAILCQESGGGAEPGFRIRRMEWRGPGTRYRHDGTIDLQTLMEGLVITCDDLIDPLTVLRRPVVFVTLFGRIEPGNPDIFTAGYRLTATVEVQDNVIFWQPSRDLPQLSGFVLEGIERPLLELTVRGHNIRALDPAEDGSPRWLDAAGLEGAGRAILPSGDRRRGGTLLSWFWLGNERRELDLVLVDVLRVGGDRIGGRVINGLSGDGVADAVLTLRLTTGQEVAQTASRGTGEFVFADVPATTLIVRAELADAVAEVTVPRLVLVRDRFGPDEFTATTLDDIGALSANMRTRLRRAGLEQPFIVANLDATELARRLDVTEATAETVLSSIRAAARREQ